MVLELHILLLSDLFAYLRLPVVNILPAAWVGLRDSSLGCPLSEAFIHRNLIRVDSRWLQLMDIAGNPCFQTSFFRGTKPESSEHKLFEVCAMAQKRYFKTDFANQMP